MPLLYGVHISQLRQSFLTFIWFAKVSGHLAGFNARIKTLTANFSNMDIGIINFGKLVLRFFVETWNWSLSTILGITLLLQGLSEYEFYGDLVYKFRKKYILANLNIFIILVKLTMI